MNNIRFESLLGKHINIAKDVIGQDFRRNAVKKNDLEIRFYSSTNFIKKDFYGMPYYHITVQTKEDEIVETITLFFNKLMDRQFFDAFNKVYGEPSSILVIEKRTVIREGTVKDDTYGFNQYLRKSELDLREGTFEEGPLYIIWKKDDFKVKALLRQQNMSQITFSKK